MFTFTFVVLNSEKNITSTVYGDYSNVQASKPEKICSTNIPASDEIT